MLNSWTSGSRRPKYVGLAMGAVLLGVITFLLTDVYVSRRLEKTLLEAARFYAVQTRLDSAAAPPGSTMRYGNAEVGTVRAILRLKPRSENEDYWVVLLGELGSASRTIDLTGLAALVDAAADSNEPITVVIVSQSTLVDRERVGVLVLSRASGVLPLFAFNRHNRRP